MSAKILFCGDSHGSLGHIPLALASYGACDAVIHVGDFDLVGPLQEALPRSVQPYFWWIPGNHDFDTQANHDFLFASTLASRCLHLNVVEIAGLRVAGLGGIFKGKVWYPPGPPKYLARQDFRVDKSQAHGLRHFPFSLQPAIWPEDIERLGQVHADILVTHEAPSCHRHGFAVIDQLALRMQASLIVHGHHHLDYESTVNQGKTRVIGVGLRGVCDNEGHRVLKGIEPSVYRYFVEPLAGQANREARR